MKPICPACDKSMKEHGRAFRCEPCREIIIFFKVSNASPYLLASPMIPLPTSNLPGYERSFNRAFQKPALDERRGRAVKGFRRTRCIDHQGCGRAQTQNN
jgi:hypothetical protein